MGAVDGWVLLWMDEKVGIYPTSIRATVDKSLRATQEVTGNQKVGWSQVPGRKNGCLCGSNEINPRSTLKPWWQPLGFT